MKARPLIVCLLAVAACGGSTLTSPGSSRDGGASSASHATSSTAGSTPTTGTTSTRGTESTDSAGSTATRTTTATSSDRTSGTSGTSRSSGNSRSSESSGSSHSAMVDAGVDSACAAADAGVPLPHTCIIFPVGADDNNECDGHHDPPAPFPANSMTGNGFDDNCNGLVDEGCSCDEVGLTKPCYLVPPTQTVDGQPVGWCAQNSVGTVACEQLGADAGALGKWSGVCRGAQPPYASDVCAPGDFDCNGVAKDAPAGCGCNPAPVACPTTPFVTYPYPPEEALPLEVNASAWFSDPSQVAMATGWTWTLTGGDCDNILPHPSFGLYATPDGEYRTPGTEVDTLGQSMQEHGFVVTAADLTAVTGGAPSVVYPAFSLSGDYALAVAWELGGQPYACSVKIHVSAPGLRADGCWSTEGVDDDLDLHVAKVNGFGTTCPDTEGWSDVACPSGNQDCYYGDCYTPGGDATAAWGYTASASTACIGWGAQATSAATCNNPRLDRDTNGLSGTCNPAIVDPNNSTVCGAENINIDDPGDGDQFAVGLRFYGIDGTGTAPSLSHVDVYCDGVRVLSSGYDPVSGAGFPALLTPGQDTGGDMWKVGLVTTSIGDGGLVSCTTAPTHSKVADPSRDGPTNAYCVDHVSADAGADAGVSGIFLAAGGVQPASADALCFH